MSNKIYISFSSDNNSNDTWVSEFLNSFKITLAKISALPIHISTGLDEGADQEKQMEQADLIFLVFNGFVSDEFSKDLKILELKYPEWTAAGKEILIIVKSGKFNSIIPVYLRRFTQYNFFEINSRTNEVVDYTPFLKGDKENKFWSKLTDLAYDTKLYFESITDKLAEDNKLTIYLAEVSKDQIVNREILKREFLLSGYRVLPSKPLPTSFKEYQDSAKELILKSDISIHIMGELYGDAPSGSDYSFQEIQNKIIAEAISRKENLKEKFYRFVWLPPNLEPYDEKQIQYLKRLKRELSDNKGSEIIQCSIEEFKELFIQKINQLAGFGQHEDNIEALGRKVIIITDNSEQAICHKIENQLKIYNRNYEIFDLSQTGDLFPLAMFRQKFRMTNGAILLNFNQNASWIQGVVGLVMKNLHLANKSDETFIAAISGNHTKQAMDFEALKVDFLPLEDSQLINKVEKFLIQLS